MVFVYRPSAPRTMSSMPREHPSVQRVNRAYVELPPSPLTIQRRVAVSALHVVQSNKAQKENRPLKPFSLPMSHFDASSTSLKRKLMDREPSSLVLEGIILPPKKAKLSTFASGAPLTVKQVTMNEPAKNNSEEFPNGLVYCHQCNKRRDLNDTIICNASLECTTNSGSSKQKPCKSKYCRRCLKNRYNEDINAHRLQNAISGFKCPRCRDICNCPKCRKAKGLEPVGVIGKPLVKKIATNSKPESKVTKEKQKAIVSEAPKVHKPPRKRELPVLKWRRVPINLTQDEADERIFIREFFFRFGDVLDPTIAKGNLEELELLGGRQKCNDEDDVTSSWATDSCLKALLLGLLGLLAKDREGEVGQMMKATMKEIRKGGVNLNNIWLALHALRTEITQIVPSGLTTNAEAVGEETLTFPDPWPPSSSATATRSLRSVRVSTDTINVFQPSQLIPVLVSLIHTALETSTIREELDQGFKDNRDYVRDAREAMKVENERWEKERKTIEVGVKDKAQKTENRAKRSAHKLQTTNIENALKIIGSSFAPRFTRLGTDDDGRVYYALSPGVAEREAALEFLEVAATDKVVKLKKKGRVLSVDERKEMREWSWFIAVWGTRPPSLSNMAKTAAAPKMTVDEEEDSEEEANDDKNTPRWWGFWDAEEITKLAEWISVRSDLGEEGESSAGRDSLSTTSISAGSSSSNRRLPRMEQLKRLVRHLREYAGLLEWRTIKDKYTLTVRASG